MLKYREPLKVDSADESSLILPRELRDGGGGGMGGWEVGGDVGGSRRVMHYTDTHSSLSSAC